MIIDAGLLPSTVPPDNVFRSIPENSTGSYPQEHSKALKNIFIAKRMLSLKIVLALKHFLALRILLALKHFSAKAWSANCLVALAAETFLAVKFVFDFEPE